MIRRMLLIVPLIVSTVHAQEATTKVNDDFLVAAEAAEKIADPLQRCLQYPDLPGNTWPRDQAKARCQLFNTPPPFTLDALDAELKKGGAKRVDAGLRKIEGDRLFIALAPFKSTPRADDAERIARAWMKASPDSAYARTALGLVLANRGWNARGTDFAGNTPDSKFRSMDAYFEAATLQFEAALASDARMIVACESLMAIGRQTSEALQASATARCLEADPASFYVIEEMMNNAEPRWGGSLAEMREVVGYAQGQMDKNPLLEILVHEPDAYAAYTSDDDSAQIAGLEPLALRVASPGYLGRAGCAMARSEDEATQLKAVVWLSESLRFWPDGQCELMNRANLLFRRGTIDWALRDAERGLVLDPGNAWLHALTATLLRLKDRPADALPHYQAMLADPEYRATAKFEACTVMLDMQRWPEARTCTEALTQDDPFNGNYWDMRLRALQTFDAPGAEDAMRKFLVYKDANYWPWHAETERKVRAWMAEHGMEE